MTNPPPNIMTWTPRDQIPAEAKHVLVPRGSFFSRLAERSYTSRATYRMIARAERFKQRTLEQNEKLWAMLGEVAAQKEHCGRRYTPDQWKVLFMHACGRECQFLPSLDGECFVPYGQSSRELSSHEMAELIEFIIAWGAENGVQFRGP